MSPEENFQEQNMEVIEENKYPLTSVTSLSKYLALILFVAMPFIGVYIGYKYSPEKVVEVERVVIKEVVNEVEVMKIQDEIKVIDGWTVYENKGFGVQVQYPEGWNVNQERPRCGDFCLDTTGLTQVTTGDGGVFTESTEPNAYIAFWFGDQDRVQSLSYDVYVKSFL